MVLILFLRYSLSSRDSVLTDSTYSGISREGSITSAPMTPDDEAPEKNLSWIMQDPQMSYQQWDDRLSHSMNVESPLSLSKSTSDLLAVSYEDNDDSNQRLSPGTPTNNNHRGGFKPPSPKLWSRKSHEAEEIEFSRQPHFSLMIPNDDFSAESPHRKHSSGPFYSRPSLEKQLKKGSPPPNVILKNFQPSPS